MLPRIHFRFRRGPFVLALIAALAIAAAAGVIWVRRPWSRVPRQLVEAFGAQPYRLVEARLMGGFAYRPLAPVTRGVAPARTTMMAAAVAMQRAGRISPSAGTAHQLGLSYLLLGAWDDAVDALDEALRLQTQRDDPAAAISACDDASLLNDLAAAYHAHGRARNRPRSFVLAAEAAQRAWALEQTAETAWNRALTADSLHQQAYALDAWRRYLEIDDATEWAAEARQRLGQASRPTAATVWQKEEERLRGAVKAGDRIEVARIVRAFPFEARMLAEQTYLVEWATLEPSPEAAERLAFCRAVGAALQDASGESMLADTVAHIDAAGAPRRAEIVRGLRVYGEGRSAYKATDFAQARETLREAATILGATGSPFAALARMYVLGCERFRDDRQVIAASDAWLASDPPDERRYPALVAQIRWVRGLSSLRLGRPQASVEEYRRALAIFERLGETSNHAFMQLTLSEAYEFVGNAADAWTHRFGALEKRGSGEKSGSSLEVLFLSASAALAEGMPAAATLFLDEILRATDDPSLFDLRFHALLARSRAHRALGDHVAADAELRQAATLAPRIVDPAIREQSMNSPEVVSDRLTAISDDRERERILQAAIDFATAKSLSIRLAQLYLLQGREYVRTRQWAAAETALFAGIGQLERQRGTILSEDERRTFFGARQPLYDALAGLLSERGDHRRAFEVVESSRARTLLDGVLSAAPAVRPLTLAEIQAGLDPDTAVIEYGRVGEGRGVWVISRGDARYVALPRGEEELRRLVDRFRIVVRRGDDATALRVSRVLHAALVEPWYGHGRRFKRLVFVPDGALAGLPFAALHDGTAFLLQRHVVSTTPSANLLLACIEKDRVRAPAANPALVVAPSSSAAGARSEVLLEATRGEAADVASQYATADMLDGARATRRAFAERAPLAEVIHFAGHTTSDDASIPQLLFATEGDGIPAVMHAEDIRALRLNATRVVVLAACDSGAERSPLDDGASSIARAFLAAGAPVVIASYWPVDDEVTASLSRRFHQRHGRGEDPLAALRSAQLEMLASPDARDRKLGTWAAFAAIGGTDGEKGR